MMLEERKNFIPLNESFVCENCKQKVPKAKGTFRNHCPFCLYSRHVDEVLPGDRKSTCGSLMQPIKVEKDNKREWMIIHQCLKCKKISRNKIATNDDREKLAQVSQEAT